MSRRWIDGHVHIVAEAARGSVNPDYRGEIRRWGILKTPEGAEISIMPPYIPDTQFTADTLVHMMDVYGVEKAVILQSLMNEQNEAVAQAVRKFPDRLKGAMIIEPDETWARQMELWREKGLTALKFEMRSFANAHPGLCYDSACMMAIFAKAQDLGLTVTIDPAPVDFPVYQPAAFLHMVRAFPKLPVVLCHMGYPNPIHTPQLRAKWEEMLQAVRLPNCWLDISAMPDFFDEEGWPYPTALKLLQEVKNRFGADKLIWGSDIPGTLLRATYPQMQKMVSQAELLTEDELDRLFYRNCAAAYGF